MKEFGTFYNIFKTNNNDSWSAYPFEKIANIVKMEDNKGMNHKNIEDMLFTEFTFERTNGFCKNALDDRWLAKCGWIEFVSDYDGIIFGPYCGLETENMDSTKTNEVHQNAKEINIYGTNKIDTIKELIVAPNSTKSTQNKSSIRK